MRKKREKKRESEKERIWSEGRLRSLQDYKMANDKVYCYTGWHELKSISIQLSSVSVF